MLHLSEMPLLDTLLLEGGGEERAGDVGCTGDPSVL